MGDEKSYRQNVAAVVLSSKYPEECEFFIAQRSDIKGSWQFPQGGIDEGETPREALFRELREEIGTDSIEIIAECPIWVKYDFPPTIATKMYPYDGQIQKYFLVRLKDNKLINIDTEIPEFDDYMFVGMKSLMGKVTYFKKQAYSQILDYFRQMGYI